MADTDLEAATRALCVAAQGFLDSPINHFRRQALTAAISHAIDTLPLETDPALTAAADAGYVSTADYLARQTKTPPVHELLHGTSNANDLMSDTFGNIVGPR